MDDMPTKSHAVILTLTTMYGQVAASWRLRPRMTITKEFRYVVMDSFMVSSNGYYISPRPVSLLLLGFKGILSDKDEMMLASTHHTELITVSFTVCCAHKAYSVDHVYLACYVYCLTIWIRSTFSTHSNSSHTQPVGLLLLTSLFP